LHLNIEQLLIETAGRHIYFYHYLTCTRKRDRFNTVARVNKNASNLSLFWHTRNNYI